MKDYGDEQVMAVSMGFLRREGFFFEGARSAKDMWSKVLEVSPFYERNTIEEDENFLQVIPYVVFVCGNDVLVYERGESGGEKRLVGRRSIGIGGHVNPEAQPTVTEMGQYLFSIVREAGEELGEEAMKAVMGPLRPVAAIHDRSNAVSRVHLGFVHIVRTDKKLPLTSSELCIKNPQYVPIKELVLEELEVWSQWAVKVLDW
jgi:predicted NUDIX family phosphoesterase